LHAVLFANDEDVSRGEMAAFARPRTPRYHASSMQIPKRKSSERRKFPEQDNHLSQEAYERIERTIERLEKTERPKALRDLVAAREMGDLSENAAYSEAKGQVARIDGRLFGLREKLKYAVVVRPGTGPGGTARVGSVVTVEVRGKTREYEITGSLETDPSSGRVSQNSPLGKALIGRKSGDRVTVTAAAGEIEYLVKGVR
jgi:transcription elongation GreA/GreB family factor